MSSPADRYRTEVGKRRREIEKAVMQALAIDERCETDDDRAMCWRVLMDAMRRITNR